MAPDLGTTNLLLGIMAVVSVLEALLLIALGVGGLMVYRRVMATVRDLETRQIAPLAARVGAILDDVKRITARIDDQTARVDQALAGTIERVDETAERVRSTIRERVDRVAGVVRGVRAAIAAALAGSDDRRTAAGHV
ncbi:MAG TPA: hypothetical protein VNI83_12690 [Vicinamibacterales bacterium]|nr:hypothetical protein [Vicinamibacterales bacterium]